MKGCSCLKTHTNAFRRQPPRFFSTVSCLFVFFRSGKDTNRKWPSVHPLHEDGVSDGAAVLTPLAVRALVGLGFASFAVGGGGGVRGGAGAATVFLLHRGRVSDGALVAVVVCGKHGDSSRGERHNNVTHTQGSPQHPPCMSIIPGDELFSGVVSSEPYFSSLPFFLFLFFYRDGKGGKGR